MANTQTYGSTFVSLEGDIDDVREQGLQIK